MGRVFKAVWGDLRELSGEAALERRMCGCRDAKAVKAAMTEQLDGVQRCC
jgi:hypothetical protein